MSEENKKDIASKVANRKLLWYYTPSQNSAEELEGIFVQRESIAKDAVERIKEGALKGSKHHLLFVGPRGCGKTHLVSLIYHRIMAMKKVSSKLRIAWLNEDEMSPSFLDLLLRIYRALASKYEDQFTESEMEPIYDLKADDAEVFLKDLILEKLGKQSLLVIVENLDELLKGLQTKGQMKWRAFIQDSRKCATLATAQKITPAVKDRKAPFHGTFQIEHLDMLNEVEAVELLKKVASFYEDIELLEYLNTEPGRQRVECLHILTGGNHRVMIVLAQFVTKDSLEELMELFFKMLNELTPYYQERLRWISAQQRKIITYLCSSKPIRVHEMAKKLFISEQTLSSQLRDLLQMGYVRRDKLGRETLYQIAEPLMRMCIDVKENNRSKPIRLIIDFLKIWCNKETLLKQLEFSVKRGKMSTEYIQSALDTFESSLFYEEIKDCEDFAQFKEKKEHEERIGAILRARFGFFTETCMKFLNNSLSIDAAVRELICGITAEKKLNHEAFEMLFVVLLLQIKESDELEESKLNGFLEIWGKVAQKLDIRSIISDLLELIVEYIKTSEVNEQKLLELSIERRKVFQILIEESPTIK